MKYLYSLTVMVFALSLASPATSVAQASFGIRAGVNASNVSFDLLPNRSERFGYHVGLFANVPVISDFMSVQPELSYSVKGAAYKPIDTRRTLNMNYVDFYLPLSFKLSIIDLQVGPFVSYLTSTPDYEVFDGNTILIDAFKKTDVGVTGGLVFNFDHLFLGIRYNQGLVDLTKDNVRPYLGSGKSAVGQISLGYKF